MQICIKKVSSATGFTWHWTVTGGHNGTALAVLERVRWQLCAQLNGPGGTAPWWNDWEPAGEEGEKICIGYQEATGGVDVSIKGLSPMGALEGLIDAAATMTDQWFGRTPSQTMELVGEPG